MINWILRSIICDEFEKSVGKNQFKNPKPRAMDLSFSISPYYDHNEDGYRFLKIRLYADGYYVKVLIKETWCIINQNWIHDNGEGIKKGKNYIEGESKYTLVSDHDSCWRDGVGDIINVYGEKMLTINARNYSDWYDITELNNEELNEIYKINYENSFWSREIISKPFFEKVA